MSGMEDQDYGYPQQHMYNGGGYNGGCHEQGHHCPRPGMNPLTEQERAARSAADQNARRWKATHTHYGVNHANKRWYQIDPVTNRTLGPLQPTDNMEENITTYANFYLHKPTTQMDKFSTQDLFADVQSMQHPNFCAKYPNFPQIMGGKLFSAGVDPNQAAQMCRPYNAMHGHLD